jgi:hypothetical protein
MLNAQLTIKQNFDDHLQQMRDASAERRERMRSADEIRLYDKRAGDALDKQNKQSLQKEVSENLSSLQKQLTDSTRVFMQAQAAGNKLNEDAQKQTKWQRFWTPIDLSKEPDTQEASSQIDNAKAAIGYLTQHKDKVIQGKEDIDEVNDNVQDILRNGPHVLKKSDFFADNPGATEADWQQQAAEAKQNGWEIRP